jgi:hypothetical protein
MGHRVKAVIQRLKDQDRLLLTRYIMRAKLGEIFGLGSVPSDYTVGQAIEDQRTLEQAAEQALAQERADSERRERERAAKLAERAKSIAAVQTFLSWELVDKTFSPANLSQDEYRDRILFVFAIANRSDKDIEGIKGTVIFDDMFGDRVYDNTISFARSLPAGQAITWTAAVYYNQFFDQMVKLRYAPPEKLKFTFLPKIVIFADGSQVTVPDEP